MRAQFYEVVACLQAEHNVPEGEFLAEFQRLGCIGAPVYAREITSERNFRCQFVQFVGQQESRPVIRKESQSVRGCLQRIRDDERDYSNPGQQTTPTVIPVS